MASERRQWLMDFLLLLIPLAVAWLIAQRSDQRRRIMLLGGHLRQHQIEPHMAQLTEGYLRALGESDPERAEPIWNGLTATEESIGLELEQLAEALKGVWGEHMRVSRWPIDLPHGTRFFPQISFDFRALVGLHAQGIARVLRNEERLQRKDRAFRATAELLLFQHSCHWYCRSKYVASARLLALHQTPYEKVLASVSPASRRAYEALVAGGD